MSAPSTMSLDPSNDFTPDSAARKQEARSYLRTFRLLGRAVPQPPAGERAPAILVPGFISGDISLAMLARHLRRNGHRTFRSGIGANLGCTDAMVDRLMRQVEQVATQEQRRVTLVGHSRGGMIVKLAALRRPDLVAGIIVLSAPVTGTLSVATHVRKQLELLFRLNRWGLSGALSQDCVTGECGARIAAELTQPWPADVAYTSVYSRRDAIIDWHTCLDPQAELVEITGSHSGMGTDLTVHRIVTDRLARITT